MPRLVGAADLMKWQIATSSQSDSERTAVQRLALQMALSRISSYKGLMNSENARLAIGDAGRYVADFGFRTVADGDDLDSIPVTRSVTESGRISDIAVVVLDADSVTELARELEAALIDAQEESGDEVRLVADQPRLIWLVIQDAGRSLLITPETGENLVRRSMELAGAFGQTLQFPGAESASLVTDSNLDTLDAEEVASTLASYKATAIVTGVVKRESARQWLGSWRRLEGEDEGRKTLNAVSLDAMLEQGIIWGVGGGTAGTASVESVDNSRPKTLTVWVAEAGTTAAYSDTLAWFEELSGVDRVFPTDIVGGGALFSVTPVGPLSDLSSEILDVANATQWLQSGPADASSPGRADLYLRYQR